MSVSAALDADESVLYAFRRNIVVAASAGTGKTHRLTALYVLLCLGLTSLGEVDERAAHAPIGPGRIVATTFSRAAALEIRARVEAALTGIAAGSASAPFAAEIAARVALLHDPPSEGELRRRAARARDELYEARIDTLHGLAGDILRRHAVALGVRPNLEILTDEELEAMSAAIIDETLAEGLEGDEAARGAVHDLVDACSGFFRARDALLSFFDRLDDDGLDAKDLHGSEPLAHAEDLFRGLSAGLRAVANGGGPTTIEPATIALAEIREAERRGADPLALSERAAAAITSLFQLRKPPKPTPSERLFFEFRDNVGGKSNKERGETLIATLTLARGLEEREAHVLALLSRIGGRLAEERRARGAVSFSDLLRLSRDRLRDRPEVLTDVQRDIDVLMVDEFQDTSRVQRDLVYLLRERPDARTRRAPGAVPAADSLFGHGLFVVGDRKQSIYGFRGADVAVFNRVCGELAGRAAGEELGLPDTLIGTAPSADFVALRKSYRSAPEIVRFVNAFSEADFASASRTSDDTSVRYGVAEQLIAAREGDTGKVLFVADDGAPMNEPLLQGAQAPLREAFSAAALASRLTETDGFAFRDIAILARRRATIPLVELGLARFGLPYVVAGRALFDTLEVRDMAALLRLLLEPGDRAALSHTLRGPLVALSDSALLSLTEDRGIGRDLLASRDAPGLDPHAFPDEAARLTAFRDRFLAERTALLRLPAAEAVRAAAATFDMDRVMAALPRAPSRLGNLDRLQKLARERKEGLFAFSRWLDRQIDDESDEQEAVVFSAEDDAIRLTTIHASKGLDFQATIVLDLAASERMNAAPLRFTRADEIARLVMPLRGPRGLRLDSAIARAENMEARARARSERSRISYVAITRARRVLGLIGSTKERASGSWLETFGAVRDAIDPLHERLDAGSLVNGALARDAVEPLASAALPAPRIPAPPPPPPNPHATTPPGGIARGPPPFRLRVRRGVGEP
ncbi:MAG: UvrD-helicase domain-containing protein, partial [Myxococcales bacterium]|nr:UvrD-helicase domain-containing protein [Myxococcales bacterium]